MSGVSQCDGSDVGATPVHGPLSVAVTGGIGAGKSTVSAALAARGAVVIDADRLAREVVAPGTPGLAAVAAEFGPRVLAPDGSMDRAEVARIVFADRAALQRLEAITHPLVRALTVERLATVPADGVAVNDIPLIRALPDAARYHLVIGVGIADLETRVRRLVARGHSPEDARARIAAQISDDDRRRLADVWIDNSGTERGLEPVIAALWDRLAAFAAHRRAGSVARGGDDAPVGDLSGSAAARPVELDRSALTQARVSRACEGRQPVLGATGPGGLTITVGLEDATAIDRLRPALLDAGFPPEDSPAVGFGSADPDLNLNLYLTVRDHS